MLRDLTRGNPTGLIINFALPMLIGNMFQQFYNIIDSVVIGRFIGKNALASVGSSFSLMNFLSAVIIGLCIGSSVVISQFFGANEYSNLRKAISTSFIFIFLFTAFLSTLTFIFAKELLVIIRTPITILNYSASYLKILLGGLIFTFLYNYFASLLRSVGDSITPLYFLIVSCIINIVLDLIFVLYFKMSVNGVAAATITSQAISSLLCAVYAYIKMPVIRIKLKEFIFNRNIFKLIANYSILTSMQQSIMTFGMVCVQGLVNTFGADTIAAFTAAGKVDGFAYLPVQDFGNAFSTYVAQNIGARRPDRVKKGVASAVRIIVVFCAVSSAIILLFSKDLMKIFVDAKELNVISIGVEYLSIVGIFYTLIGFFFMFYGLFRGIGNLSMSIILTIISLGTRVFMAYTLASIHYIGRKGIWWAIPIGWALADLVGFIKYKTANFKLSR